jgi:Ca-activated chloride channel family protein
MLIADESHTKTLSPYFFVKNGDPAVDSFPLKSTVVRANISGVIVDVTVIQSYKNEGTRPINAKYVFPASTRAAVHDMRMTIGDYVIRAKIKERQQAKKEFEQAKKQGKSASLLQQQRPNVFSMSVANIMPGDQVDIELCYTELLIPTDGIYEFAYPTVVGPRYSNQPEDSAPPTDLWVKNPYLKEGETLESEFHMTLKISTGIPLAEIDCISHKIHTAWQGEANAEIKLDPSDLYGGNRDFIFRYKLSGEKIQSGLILYEGENEKYFLLMSQPPERISTENIPAREYIFIVDVSGSMHGFPLDISKKLLRSLIGNLRSTDSFNVILFAGCSSLMAPASLPANKENIQKAITLINRQRGGGGTELYSAMHKGINLPKEENSSRSIIVVTDGYISAEKSVFDLIQKNIGKCNVFSFGIGSSVNRFLIEGMARTGAGEPFVITEPSKAGQTAKKFREYIESPVLTNISVNYNGFEAYDVQPKGIPDLFALRPIVLIGKWRGNPEGIIEISGQTGSGTYGKTIHLSHMQRLDNNRALRYLWARTKIANLSDYNQISRDKALVEEITSMGLKYNLLTKYTSFIAILDIIKNPEGQSLDVKQPLPLPKGISNLAVGGLASTPEPELIIMLLILIILAGTIMAFKKKRRSV